jgi:hypothetical protein
MAITIFDAIKAINPYAEFGIEDNDYNKLHWYEDESVIRKPTLEEINAKIAELEAEYEANEYQRDRKEEYPLLAEQLDYIYHNGVEAWKTDMILPVKNKYPKPTE